MLNLTKKAAGCLNVQWHDLQQREGDFWKIDILMIDRIPKLLIIHEYTLFNLVRRKSQFKSIKSVAEEILNWQTWSFNFYSFD